MNSHQQRLELTRRYVDGTATAEETRALEEALRTDAAFRREFLRYTNVDAALGSGRLSAVPVERRVVRHPAWTDWLSWRPLSAAAAGLVFGMFCSSMVWAYVGPYAGKVMTLLQEGFESGTTEISPGLPRETGVWSGDEARVAAADEAVKPKSGAKMLRFFSATFAGENAKQSAWGDVYRLVDLRGQVNDAKSVLRLSASFDGVQFPVGAEYWCSVELCALESDVADAPQPLALPWVRENSASVAERKFRMKGDGVWQQATVEVPVSPQTQFVLAHLAVLRRKPFPPTEPVQFEAHYLDAVKLELLSRLNTP